MTEQEKSLEQMNLKEVADLMGARLSIALFKGRFQDEVTHWALVLVQAIYKGKRKTKRRR
jgi:hypothetical protein